MFTVVVYEVDTRRVLFTIDSANDGTLGNGPCPIIKRNDIGYEIFLNRKPVFCDDDEGQLCLQENSWIINSNVLQGISSDNNDDVEGLDLN